MSDKLTEIVQRAIKEILEFKVNTRYNTEPIIRRACEEYWNIKSDMVSPELTAVIEDLRRKLRKAEADKDGLIDILIGLVAIVTNLISELRSEKEMLDWIEMSHATLEFLGTMNVAGSGEEVCGYWKINDNVAASSLREAIDEARKNLSGGDSQPIAVKLGEHAGQQSPPSQSLDDLRVLPAELLNAAARLNPPTKSQWDKIRGQVMTICRTVESVRCQAKK